MPPHVFLGYTIAEWLALLSIIGVLGGYFIWLVNHFIVQPLSDSINRLSTEVKDFKDLSRNEHSEFKKHFDRIDDRLDDHENHLTRHDEEIKTLFKREEFK